MIDITAVGEILIDLTRSGVNKLGIPVYAVNPGSAPALSTYAEVFGK